MKKIAVFILAFILILGCVPLSVFATPYVLESEGYDVYEIQYILKKFGYFSSDCTGYYGEATSAAVKAFQKDCGLEDTGSADEDTVAAIRAAGCIEAAVNVKTQLNVRELPSSESEVIDSLTRDSVVYIYSEKDGWYHVKTENGIQGYIIKKYLTEGSAMGIAGTITDVEGTVNLRSGPDMEKSVVAKIENGQEVYVIGGQGDWFEINCEGQKGYIFKKYVNIGGENGAATTLSELFDAWTGSVTASSLKVRSGPSTGYDVLSTLSKGTSLSVLGESGGWYYVEMKNGTKGYASKDYIQKGTGATTCTIQVSNTLNVRKGPGTGYDVVASVKNGTVVTLLDDSGSWYKIKTSGGTEGYIDSQYAKLGGSLSSNTSSSSSGLKAPSGTFRQGSEGSSVVTIQKRLRELGYLSASATGYYGSATVAAVRSFQKNNGLSSDGVCGENTLSVLFSSSAQKASASSSSGSGSSSSGGSSSGGSSSGSSALGQQIAEYSKNFLGVPYVLGANGPNSFDCSGFTKYVYAHFGISLPRTAYSQGYWNSGTKISSISELQIGDLVFFNTVNDNDLCDHAGIYLGNGQVIHASSGSTRKVIISSLSENYYKTRFSWGRRVI